MNTVDSAEEKLADLIEVLFAWIEQDSPTLLIYGTINFRRALERFFYFEGLHRPESLSPLLLATSMWRNKEAPAEYAEFYDQCVRNAGTPSVITRIKAVCRTAKRVTQLYFLGCTSYLGGRTPSLKTFHSSNQSIGFFAVNSRFVGFFSDVVNRLRDEHLVFFSDNQKEIRASVKKLGVTLKQGPADRIVWKDVGVPLFHGLFPFYSVVLLTYLKLAGTLRSCPLSVLVFSEGTSVGDELASQAARKLGIPTVRLQSGRAGVLHSGYRGMSFDKMLCWGEGFVERYRMYSPDPEYVITGSPLLDDVIDKGQTNVRVVSVFTQPISRHISSTDYQLLVDLTENLILRMPDVRILVRKHPVDGATDFDDLTMQYPAHIEMMSYFDSSLRDVLRSSTVAIGFFSTTLSEAAACGVVPVILKLRDQHSVFPFPERYGAAIVADNAEEALNLVINLLGDPQLLSNMRENMGVFTTRFFGPSDGLAMERIINVICGSAIASPHAHFSKTDGREE